MSLRGGLKWVFHTDVQLARADAEPATASGAQRFGLFDLRQAQQVAKETASFGFAAFGRGNLDMVDAGDEHGLIMPNLRASGEWRVARQREESFTTETTESTELRRKWPFLPSVRAS